MHIKPLSFILALSATALLSACGGNAKTAGEAAPTATEAPAATEPAAEGSTEGCLIKAKLGTREWVAHGLHVIRVKEHLTIGYDGDGDSDPNDISGLQIQVHNFNGPGTYTFTGDGNVSFLVSLMDNVAYLTAATGSSGSITISEYTPTSIKASFQFKAGKSDTTPEFLEVTGGVVEAKDGAGGCSVSEMPDLGTK